jgi:dTDP-4-amino-4,6-dideoxygalactose transaminase
LILLNDFKRQWDDIGEKAMDTYERVGRSGWYILGEEVVAFENALAQFSGVRHAVGVASGLDAIQIALEVAGCKHGDRVLTTPLSAFATTLAIVRMGAVPVFVDIDRYGLIDLDQAEQILSSDQGIRFFLPVHLFGHSCDLDRLKVLQEKYDVVTIEDCAQSIAATWNGVRTGTVGAIACTSFYPTKNLGAMGDAGAMLTNNTQMNQTARSLRDYGQSSKYLHTLIGWNSRLDEFHAAYLHHVALRHIEAWTARRREVAGAYLAGISNSAIDVVGHPLLSNSNWHLFPLLVDPTRRKHFRDYLLEKQVQSGEHYPIAIPDQPAIASLRIELPFDISRTRQFCGREVSIPIHPYLTQAEVEHVIDAVNSWKG